MKIKISRLIQIFIIVLVNIIFMLEFNPSQGILIFLNVVLIFIAIVYNKFSIISLTMIVFNLLWIAIMIQVLTGTSYGLLQENVVPLHTTQILIYSFIYNDITTIFSMLFRINHHEKSLIQNFNKFNYSKKFILFCNLIAVVFTIVAFPRLSLSVSSNERFDMLLPGHAWNELAIIGLIFNLRYLRDTRSVQIVYMFCIFWFLANGERVDITGLLLGILIYFAYNITKNKIRSILKGISLLTIMVIIMIIIGNLRIGYSSYSFNLLSIFTFSTASDVAYLFNVTIDYIDKFQPFNGQIFLSNLYQILPFMTPKLDFSTVISQIYPYPGGEPIVSAGLMDFGMLGMIITTVIDNLLIRFILIFKNKLFYYEYLLLLCSIPRIIWYGRSYVFTGLLFFIPIMVIISSFLNKNQHKLVIK